MLGLPPPFMAQMVAERRGRLAVGATGARWRRDLRRPHPAPPCAALAAQLPDLVLDLGADAAAETEPAATR